jgi:hypothetical protein
MLVSYVPPGPVAGEFHRYNDFVRAIKGPVGSGKSSSCCMEIVSRAIEIRPTNDKVRRSRWCVTRNTYPELKTTTIKTWEDWFGPISTLRWDIPITATLKLPDLGDGTSLDLEVIFLAMDRPEDVGKMRSLELTGGWMNEASEMEKAVLDMLTQRVGRYPAKREFAGQMIDGKPFDATDPNAPMPYWSGVIMDTNPPDDDSWWYELAEKKPDGYRFFDQPGGLYLDKDKKSPTYGQHLPNPAAENAQNLPGGYNYYLKQLSGKTEAYIKVFLRGEYGSTLDGKPVYPEWREDFHLSKEPLKANPGLPIILSFDFGLTPACAFIQIDPKGRLLVLDELVSEDMGIRQFYESVVRPYKMAKYAKFRVEAVGDPAGSIRAQTDEKTCMEELRDMGLLCEPADTNEFIKRRESVAYWLQQARGGEPGFLLDPSCKVLKKGFNSGYRYERVKASGPERFKDRPVKDKYSHIHDALQYGAMHARGDINPVVAKPVKKSGRMRAWVTT